jgi:hypothetical protein
MKIRRFIYTTQSSGRFTVNNRAIMPKDTEQDIVLAPAAYWQHSLELKLKNFLSKKNRPFRSEDTNVVVSVTERPERDLTKRFDDSTIDWGGNGIGYPR